MFLNMFLNMLLKGFHMSRFSPSHAAGSVVAALAGLLVASSAIAADLTVTVEGAKAGEGKVMIALFDTANGFPAAAPKQGQFGEVAQDKAVFTFKDLPPGRYAVSAFQDRNNNQKLDANMMGLPTEPYGFSRNATGRMGPPKFDDAAVTFDTQPQAIAVRLK